MACNHGVRAEGRGLKRCVVFHWREGDDETPVAMTSDFNSTLRCMRGTEAGGRCDALLGEIGQQARCDGSIRFDIFGANNPNEIPSGGRGLLASPDSIFRKTDYLRERS